MLGATHGDRLDVVASLASPLPVRVIAELLGADAERAADFRAWADASTRAASGSARGGFDEEAMVAVLAMAEHLGNEIEERQRAPRDDLLTTLVRARGDDVLAPEEAVGFAAASSSPAPRPPRTSSATRAGRCSPPLTSPGRR